MGSLISRITFFIVIAGSAVFAFWPEGLDGSVFKDALSVILATFPLMLLAILLIGWRLAILSGREVSLRDGMAVNAVAQLTALIVPSRLSEIAKPVGLNLIRNVPLSRGVTILAIERIFDAIFLAGLALAAVAVLSGAYRQSIQTSGLILAALAVAGLFIIGTILMRPRLLDALANWLPTQWLRNQIEHVAEAISRLADPRTALLVFGLSAISWLAAYLIFAVFFLVLGIGALSQGEVLVVFVASTLGLIVSVAPGGLGTFEGAIALSLTAFDVPVGTAVAMALLLRLCLVIPVVAAASWFLVSGDLSLSHVLGRLRNWRGTDERSA